MQTMLSNIKNWFFEVLDRADGEYRAVVEDILTGLRPDLYRESRNIWFREFYCRVFHVQEKCELKEEITKIQTERPDLVALQDTEVNNQ